MPKHLIEIDSEQRQATLFVEKKFAGKAGVTISAGNLVSTNAEYNTQLESARVGSPVYPFPCIWSAKKKAIEIQETDGIETVNIIITDNYSVTLGSPVLTENGDVNASIVDNEEADIKVANVLEDLQEASLLHHDLNYVFGNKSQIINICKSYAIYLLYEVGNQTEIKFNILGNGIFRWIYGDGQAFTGRCVWLINNTLLNFRFEAELLMLNFWQMLMVHDFQYLQFDFNRLYMYDTYIGVYSTNDWKTAGLGKPLFIMNVNDYRRGRDLFTGLSPAPLDFSAGIHLDSWYGYDAHIHLKNARLNDYSPADGSLLRVAGRFARNNVINLTVDNLHHTFVPGRANGTPCMQIFRHRNTVAGDETLLQQNRDNVVFIHIKNAISEVTLGTNYETFGMVTHSKLIIQLDNWTKIPVSSGTEGAALRFTYAGDKSGLNANNKIEIKANVTSYAPSSIYNNWNWKNYPDDEGLSVVFDNCTFIHKLDGYKVIDLTGQNPNVKTTIKDSILSNDGVTDTISHDGLYSGIDILTRGVTVNGPVSANARTVGEAPLVVPTLRKYTKR